CTTTCSYSDKKGNQNQWDYETAGDYEVYMRQSVNSMLEFVHEIVTGDNFAGTQINSVRIALPISFIEEVEEEELMEEEGLVEVLVEEPPVTRPTATINIRIHSYQGE
ncbi:hypothetical protein ACFLTV_01445, partial [Chloroflexota bacterium]